MNDTPSRKHWLDYFGWQIPVTIILVTLLITNIMQLRELMEQKDQLNKNKAQLEQVLPRVEIVRTKLDALARDIVDMAKTNPSAKQIQEELKIQIADNSASPSASLAK